MRLKIFAGLTILGLLTPALAGCSPPPNFVPTAQTVDTMYYHVNWQRSKKPYADIWTRGIFYSNRSPWLPSIDPGRAEVRFFLGNRWETFEYYPGVDRLVRLPQPNYKGPDRILFHQTGEDIIFSEVP